MFVISNRSDAALSAQKPVFSSKARFNGTPAVADTVSFRHPGALRFGNILNKNHGLRLPLDVDLNLDQSAQVQRAVILKSIEKKALGDNSHLTFFVDSAPDFNWPAAADGLADALRMADVPVDTVIKSYLGIEGLKPFLSATGKRFMYDRARIVMGPPQGWYNGPVHEANARVRLYNEKQRDLEWLIMDRAGKSSRTEVIEDLRRGEQYNALTALAYGSKGLVDAVIVGEDDLLTRAGLEAYYAAHNLAGDDKAADRAEFNGKYDSINQVVAWARQHGKLQTVGQFSSDSVAKKPSPLYTTAAGRDATDVTPSDHEKAQDLIADLSKLIDKLNGGSGTVAKKKTAKPKTTFHIYTGKKPGDSLTRLDRQLDIIGKENRRRIEIEHVPAGLGGTYMRDTLYFPQGFDVKTGNQFEAALLELFEKKKEQQAKKLPVKNILVVENSPGGMSIVTEQLRSVIEHGGVPVDVLIQGMGASGGSKLVSMATGNRFATPNAIILLHQTRGGSSVGALDQVNASNEGMNYSSEGYKKLVAERSGRPYEEVKKDFMLDFWINSVESMVYGKNGLIDAILVDNDRVLTRQAVMDFIVEKKGGKEAAEAYIEQHFANRREGENQALPKNHREINDDPLSNPLQVIEELVRRGKAVPMASVPQFADSTADVSGDGKKTLDLYTVLTS